MQIDVIDPKKTAMIVVDMQNDFVASGAALETPAARAAVPKLADALKVCREAGIKVIYTAHAHRRDGRISSNVNITAELKLRERVVPLCQFQSSSSGQVGTLERLKRDKSAAKLKKPGRAMHSHASPQ